MIDQNKIKDYFIPFTDKLQGAFYPSSLVSFFDDYLLLVEDEHFDKVDTYIKSVIDHKINVLEAGIELVKYLGLSESEYKEFKELLIIHDLSKFSKEEIFGYALWDFKTWTGDKYLFDAAWLHHKNHNPHHPEYWLNVNRSGVPSPLQIPKKYVIEMVADWIGAGKSYGNSLITWLPDNIGKFVFHSETELYLQEILGKLDIQFTISEYKGSNKIEEIVITDKNKWLNA